MYTSAPAALAIKSEVQHDRVKKHSRSSKAKAKTDPEALLAHLLPGTTLISPRLPSLPDYEEEVEVVKHDRAQSPQKSPEATPAKSKTPEASTHRRKPSEELDFDRTLHKWDAERLEERTRERALLADFLVMGPGHSQFPDMLWLGAEILGQGGQGIAGMWVNADIHGNVVDRVVAKEVHHELSKFQHPDLWRCAQRYGVPREVGTYMAVDPFYKKANAWSTFVRLREHSVRPITTSYRIYMDYCALGSLGDVMENQRKRLSSERKIDGTTGMICQRPGPVPEPFLWYLFRDLAQAAIYLEETLIEHGTSSHEVIHQDLKPDNIFLDTPNPDDFPCYPKMKVGDFGSARMTASNDTMNPFGFRGDPKTEGFIPPEYSEHGEPLTTAVNIWQIGMIMHSCMLLEYPEPLPRRDEPHPLGMWKPKMDHLWFYEHYSADLIWLVGQCLDPVPSKRISAYQLYREAADPPLALLDGMDGVGGLRESKAYNWLNLDMQERYKVGMSFPKTNMPAAPAVDALPADQ